MFNKYYKGIKKRVVPFILILAMLMQSGMGEVVLASDTKGNTAVDQTDKVSVPVKTNDLPDKQTEDTASKGAQESLTGAGKEEEQQEVQDKGAANPSQEPSVQPAPENTGQESEQAEDPKQTGEENGQPDLEKRAPIDWTQRLESLSLALDKIVYQEEGQQAVTVKNMDNRLDLSKVKSDTVKAQQLFIRFAFDQAKMDDQLKEGDTFSFYVPREYMALTDTGGPAAVSVCSREAYEAEPSEYRNTESFGTYEIRDNVVTFTVTELPASGNLFGVLALDFQWKQENITEEGTVCALTLQEGIKTEVLLPKMSVEVKEESNQSDGTKADSKEEEKHQNAQESNDKEQDSQKEDVKSQNVQKDHTQSSQKEETILNLEGKHDEKENVIEDGNIFKRLYRSVVSFFTGEGKEAEQNYAGGHSFSHTFNAEDLPEGFSRVQVTASNKNGGYKKGDDLRVHFKFNIILDEDHLYKTLENEIMKRPDYPVQGSLSDKEYEDKVTAYLNQLEESGELAALEYRFDLGQDFRNYSSAEDIELTDDAGDPCGKVIVKDGTVTFHFYGSCYYYEGIVALYSMEAMLNADAVSDDPIDVAFGDHGELIHQSAGGIDDGTGGTEDSNYYIEKEGPARVSNSEITYTVKAGVLKDGKMLNGLLVTDTLLEGLELKSVTYQDRELALKNVYDDTTRTFQYQFPALNDKKTNQITEAEFTLQTKLTDARYQDVILTGEMNEAFKNQAELRKKDDPNPLNISDEVTTNMKFTFLSKQGQQEQLNGARYSWTITANTQLPYLEYGYLVDTLCWTDHRYDFDSGITVHTSKGDIVYKNGDIKPVTGGPKWEDLSAEGLKSFLDTAGITGPCYYLYDAADANPFYVSEEATPDEPEMKQMALLVLPFGSGDGWTGSDTQIPLRVKYFTDLNLHGLSVDDYLVKVQTDKTLNPEITNRATLLWHNRDGKGPGPALPESITWDKTGSSHVKAMSKKGVSYKESTQELTWRMDVNHYGASLQNVVIEDVLSDTYDLDVDQGLTINMRRYNQENSVEEADSPTVLKRVQDLDQMVPGTYMVYQNAEKKKVIQIALGDLVTWENGTAEHIYCVLDFKLKLKDPKYLAVHSADQIISNTAKITATLNGKPFEDTAEGSIQVPNRLIDKTAVGSYNYQTHMLTWQIEVNPNKLPIEAAKITDTLPKDISWKQLTDIKKDGKSLAQDQYKSVIKDPVIQKQTADSGDKITIEFQNLIEETYTFTFESEVTDEWIKVNQVDANGIAKDGIVLNHVQLDGKIYGQSISKAEDTAEHVVGHVKVGKSGVYNKDEGIIIWTVLMNVDKADISGMHLVEDLTHNADIHELDMNSIKVETVTIDQEGNVDVNVPAVEVTAPDLRSIDSNSKPGDQPDVRGFAFYVPTGSEDHNTYRITFQTELLVDAPKGNLIENKVYLNRAQNGDYDESGTSDGGYNGDFEAQNMVTKSTRPKVTMTKASGNSVDLSVDQDAKLLLEDADFQLTAYTFEADSAKNTIQLKDEVGKYNKDGTTDHSGDALFLNIKAKSSTGETLVYKLVETKAPAGYKTTEPTYIIFTENPDTYAGYTSIVEAGSRVSLNSENYFVRKAVSDVPKETTASLTLTDEPLDSTFTFGKKVAVDVNYDKDNISYTYGTPAKKSVVFKITPGGNLKDKIKTQYVSNDVNGNFTIKNLDPGTYTLTEVASPAYMTIGAEYTLTVEADGANSCKYTISGSANHNTQLTKEVVSGSVGGQEIQVIQDGYLLGNFSFTKQVKYEDSPANGENPQGNTEKLGQIAFQLKSTEIAGKPNSTFVQVQTSGTDGNVHFTDVPVGVYLLSEGTITDTGFVEKVDGYVQNDHVKVIVNEAVDKDKVLGTDSKDQPYYAKKILVTYEKKDTSADALDFIQNGVYSNTAIKGTIAFTKVAEAGSTGLTAFNDNKIVLDGVKFGLFRKIGTDIANSPTLATSNADGKVVFDDVEYSNYVLKEIETPTGYKKADSIEIKRENFSLSTNSSGTPAFFYEVTGLNAVSGYVKNSLNAYAVKFMKQDQDGNPLADKEFYVYRRNSKAIGTDGAGLEVDAENADSYYQYQPFTQNSAAGQITTPMTGLDGSLELKNLPYGDYLLVENTAGGNLLDSYGKPAIHISIGADVGSNLTEVRMTQSFDGELQTDHYAGFTPKMTGKWIKLELQGGGYTVVNQIQHFYVQVQKTAGNENADGTLQAKADQKASGARFAVYEGDKASGEPYLTLDTNSQGQFAPDADGAYKDAKNPDVSKHLWVGKTYSIKEISAPDGLDMVTDTNAFAVIDGTKAGQGDSFYVWRDRILSGDGCEDQLKVDHVKEGKEALKDHLFVNSLIRGKVILTKVDATKQNLKVTGAEFQLKETEGQNQGKVVGMLKDSGDGEYVLAPIPDTVSESVQVKEMKNGVKADYLYNAGSKEVPDYRILAGKYTIEETKAPDGYEKAEQICQNNTIEVSASGDREIRMTLEETPVSLKIIKKSTDTDVELSGAEFDIIGKFKDYQDKTDTVKTLEQANNERGFLVGETYTLHEKTAPDGFLLGLDVKVKFNEKGEVKITAPIENCPAQLDPADLQKQTLIYRDDPIDIKLRKVNESGKLLAGAVFQLEGMFVQDGVLEDDLRVLTVTSKEDDLSLTSALNEAFHTKGMNLAQGQSYSLTEITAPEGYVREKTVVKFTLNQDGTIAELDQDAWKNTGYSVGKDAAKESVVVQLKNEPIVFSLKKTTESGAPQEGVGFVVTPKAGSSFMDGSKKEIKLTTGENGTAELSYQLKHENTYTVHEESALAGYSYAEDFEIFVDKDGGVKAGETTVTADQPYLVVDQALKIRICKKDDAGTAIQGILFTLTKESDSGKKSWSLSSNAEGFLEVADSKGSRIAELNSILEAGQRYLLTENVKVGSPYVALEAPVKFQISRDGRIVEESLIAENTVRKDQITLDQNGLTLEIQNRRTDLGIRKVDEKGQPLDGAKLGIYSDDQGKIGSLVSLNKTKLNWTSKADEVYKLCGLPTGTYWLKETKAPTGYVTAEPICFELKSDNTIEIKQTANTKKQKGRVDGNIITMTDERVVGTFTLVKTQNGTNTPIEGAVFSLYQQAGEAPADTDVLLASGITITADGTWSMKGSDIQRQDDSTKTLDDGLFYGRYYLKEMSTPDGYQLDETPILFTIEGKQNEDVVSQPDSKTVRAENSEYRRQLRLEKQDKENQSVLAGAVFSLTRIQDAKGNQVTEAAAEATTDSTGTAVFTIGKKGTYRLAEIKAPNGYVDASSEALAYVKEFTVDDHTEDSILLEPDTTKNVVANERKTGTLRLTKQDSLDGQKLDDVVFTLYQKDEEDRFQMTGEFSTGNNYTRTAGQEWKAEPGEAGELTVSGLTWGEYYIEETLPLDGYVTNDTRYEFYIGRYQSDLVLSVDQGVITNTQTEIRFNKVGIYNENCSDTAIGAPSPDAAEIMEGVTFTAYTDSDTQEASKVAEAVSDSSGEVVFQKLAIGTYYIKETALPKEAVSKHYKLDEKTYMAVLDQNGQFAGLQMADATQVADNTVINDVERTDIVIEKVDEKNPDRKLPGSTYGLYKRAVSAKGISTFAFTENDGSDGWIQIAKSTTDEKGILRFTGVLMDTEYQVRELAAPDGCYISEQPFTISFKMENGTVMIQSFDDGKGTAEVDPKTGGIVWKEPQVQVEFAKKDEDGNLLKGAELQVQDEEGNVVESWTSKAGETYTSYGKLIIGKTYRLVETKAPAGYEIAEPVTFTIPTETVGPNENKMLQIEMIDKKTPKKEDPSKEPGKDDKTEQPKKPGTDEKPKKPDSLVQKLEKKVKTGDVTDIWTYILMLTAAALVIGAAAYKKKRR